MKKTKKYDVVMTDEEMNMRNSVAAVENLLGYHFNDPNLLEEALTHSSYADSASYQRLEFLGDAALGQMFTNHVYLTYPGLDPGRLSLLRSANISTEKLARVAIRHGLYNYLRRNAPALDDKVREFALAIIEEGVNVPFGGSIKAPKVLADIVESIAAAVYVDCNLDLNILWEVFSVLMEPIVTLETLQQQPVTMLYELCQKQGKSVDIKHWKKESTNIANVYIDGKLLGTGSSEQKEIAKLIAAKESLQKIWSSESSGVELDLGSIVACTAEEEEGSKQALNELCSKMHWPKPSYRPVEQLGPAHAKRFIYSVQVETPNGIFVIPGDEKPRVKDAENSAAFNILQHLRA